MSGRDRELRDDRGVRCSPISAMRYFAWNLSRRRGARWAYVVGCLVFVALAAWRLSGGVTPWSLAAAGLMMVAGLSPLIGIAISRRTDPRSLAVPMLDEGECPSCGYALRNLRPHPDACVVCPECGAAWSRHRIGRHTEPEP